MMNKMTLGDILPYFMYCAKVRIVIMDYDLEIPSEEEIFCGSACDVPWNLVNLYLHVDGDGEAIDICPDDPTAITIYVVEDPANTKGNQKYA